MTVSVDDDIALVTLVQAKAYLTITASSEDEILSTLVNAMSQLAKDYCGRDFVSTDFVEQYDGDGSDSLMLRNYPLISVDELYNADAIHTFDASTEIDIDADVMVEPDSGILRLWNDESRFLRGRGNVKVVYTAGYETIPWDVQQAVLVMIGTAYKRQYQDQRFGIQSETIGQRTMTYTNDDIPKTAKAVLDHYRRAAGANRGF